jgi:hypothetical protein
VTTGTEKAVFGRFLLLLGLGFLGLAALLALALVSRPGEVSDPADGDRTSIAQGQVITAGQTVRGDVVVPLGNITVAAGATVLGDVTTQAGDVTVAGTVQGNVTSFTGDVILEPTAYITGTVLAPTGKVSKAPGALVLGEVAAPLADLPVDTGGGIAALVRLLAGLVGGVLLLLLGGLAMLAAPRQVARMAATLEHAIVPSAVVGVLTAVLLPLAVGVVGLILAITIVGPAVLALVVLTALLVGLTAVGIWVGEWLAQSQSRVTLPRSPLARGLVGLALLLAANALVSLLLPWLGWGLLYLLSCLGLGAMVLSRFGTVVPVTDGTFNLRRVTHPLGGEGEPPERKAS